MSTTDIDPRRDALQNESDNFALDSNSKITRRVTDDDAIVVLNAILAAVGGSTGEREIFNISIAAANTEQSQALPTGTVSYLIRTRGSSLLKVAYVSGESGTKYITVPGRSSFQDDKPIEAGGTTIYFQSPDAGDIVEIIAWI